ncbi:MAG: flagellar motor switch protein FliM [Calditerrivibrio sp.]|nr:flagellar motor switch protein FliM [Calditerrivibrio sp.]
MADILSQEEIDALLSTVADTGLKDEAFAPEVDFVPKKISVYDFRRPDRVSKEQIRSIRNLHDKFARNFSSSLSNFLRTITDVNLVSVDQMTYGEFLMSLPDPTNFNIISLIPLDGSAVLEINPSLVFPIVDKLLGGPGLPMYKVRELTALEQHIMESIIYLILKELEDTWKQVLPNIKFRKEITENSPQVVQIVAQNEVVILVVFEVKFSDVSGMINLCLPAVVLEPVLGKISSQDWLVGAKKAKSSDFVNRILDILMDAVVPVRLEIEPISLTVGEVLDLNISDTIVFDHKVDKDVILRVNNLAKFETEMGIVGVKKGALIKKICEERESVEAIETQQ